MITRLRLAKQLQLSTTPGSLPVTDGSNEQQYLVPGSNGDVLTIVAGVPAYAAPTGGFTGLTLDASTGTPEPIADGDTLTFLGGSGIATNVLPTDTVSIGIDYTDAISADGGNTLAVGGDGKFFVPAGAFSLTLDADSGVAETLSNGDTLDIAGGAGVSTVVSASDTVTVAVAATEESFDYVGGETTAVLATAPTATLPILVFRNGVKQREGVANDWTRVGTTITFSVTFVAGEYVQVVYYTS